MNVLHLITTIERGGAENQLRVLVREQIKQEMNVQIVPLKGKPDLLLELERDGAVVNSNLVNLHPLKQLILLLKLVSMVDIIHAHLPRAELIGSLAKRNSFFVISKHNTEPFFPKAPKLLSLILARFVNSRADAIIAISNAVKNYLVQKKEINTKRDVHVIYYGFDESEIIYLENSEFEKIRQSTKHFLVTVSRLTAQKDLSTLLRAVHQLKEKYEDIQLAIFGEGDLQGELEALCLNLKIANQVHFLGKTANPRIAMKCADLFVLTSKYEGFGLVLVEAMTSKVPIIAANNSAIPEVLGEDHPLLFKTGNSLDLSKTIETYFENGELEKSVLLHQKERLKMFTPSHMSNLIYEVYCDRG